MLDIYLYSENHKYKYFEEYDLKIRNMVSKPLFIQKISWHIVLFLYCLYIKINTVSFTSRVYYIGNIVIGIAIIGTFISLTIMTIRASIMWQSIEKDELKFTYKKYLAKKWISFFIDGFFIVSLVIYCGGNHDVAYKLLPILIMTIVLKILTKLGALGLNKFRLLMLQSTLNPDEEDDVQYEKVEEVFQEYIRDQEAIELMFGTDFKQIIVEMNSLLKKLEEVTKEEKNIFQNKTYLITNLSHDLKTPLTSIINSVYILKNDDLTKEEIDDQISILKNKLYRLETLIKDLNQIMGAEYTGISLNKKNIALNKLLEKTINSFDEKMKNLNLDMRVNIPNENAEFYLDENKTMRMFENILSNIEKYALEDTRVYIDMEIEEEHINIEFKNISRYDIEVDKNTIGNRFVKGDKSRNTEGHGLGISIIKSLAKIQGIKADISIEGDLFKVTLRFNRSYNRI